MGKLDLKYLFHAKFVDGDEFIQSADDISNIDPEKRSQYYDLLQEVEKGRVIRLFSLVGEGHSFTVDLGTGLFYVDGIKILLESKKLPTLPDKFNLIFYRQRTQSVNVKHKADKAGKMKVISVKPTGDDFCEYFIGWHCRVMTRVEHKSRDGKKWVTNELRDYEQKLAVS